jgi:hypothetical protein
MIFDGADGYATAQKLMAGRFKGIEAATAPEKTFGKGAKPIDWSKPKEKQPVTQEDYVQRNMARYNNQVSTVSAGI